MTPTGTDGLISREAALELLRNWTLPKTITPYGAGYNAGILDAIKAIQNSEIIPSVDAEPVQHGRWILDSSDEYADHYSCSRCGAEIDLCNEIYSESTPEYCQHCGARMDEGEDAG